MAPPQPATDAAANATNEAASQGPPEEMGEAVPGFVADVHAHVNEFLGGGIDALGEAVSSAAGSSAAGDVAAAAADVAMAVPL